MRRLHGNSSRIAFSLFVVFYAETAKAQIAYGGGSISNQTVTVAIGQEITLDATTQGTNGGVQAPGWGFGSVGPVTGLQILEAPQCPYYPSSNTTSCSTLTRFPSYPSTDTNTEISFYFYVPGTYNVSYQYYTNGGGQLVNLKTTFNVVGPGSITLTPTWGTIQIVQLPSSTGSGTDPYLSFGSAMAGGTPGYTLTAGATQPANYIGQFKFLQVLNGDQESKTASGVKYNCDLITGLDAYTTYPNAYTSQGVANWFYDNTIDDSPASDLAGDTTLTRSFEAITYLIWTPPTSQQSPNVVEVPIADYIWEWSATANEASGIYSVENDANSSPYMNGEQGEVNVAGSSPAFPKWNYVAASPFNYVCPAPTSTPTQE